MRLQMTEAESTPTPHAVLPNLRSQIDDAVVVDNDGNHGSRIATGHIPVRQGFHKILPTVCEKRSQLDSPFPSTFHVPSTW